MQSVVETENSHRFVESKCLPTELHIKKLCPDTCHQHRMIDAESGSHIHHARQLMIRLDILFLQQSNFGVIAILRIDGHNVIRHMGVVHHHRQPTVVGKKRQVISE